MSKNTDMQQNNSKLLDDIQKLQYLEQSLFSQLEKNAGTMSSDEQMRLIDKINTVSDTRLTLYETLNKMNDYFRGAAEQSHTVLTGQSDAVIIVERELNSAKDRLALIESQKNNKIRMVQINDYYAKQYSEHTDFMKIVVAMLVPILILQVLKNKGLVPEKIYYALVVAVSVIGAVFLVRVFFSIISRSKMNYDAYQWNFDPASTESAAYDESDDSNNPWKSPSAGGCYGETCCSTGQYYDTVGRVCVTGSDPLLAEPASEVEAFAAEIEKNPVYAQINKKPDVTLQ